VESDQISDEIAKLYQFNIDRELNIDQKADTFLLKPFDYIYVRKAPSYHEQRTVFIKGEVRYPGVYSIGSKKERISDLISRAGGLTPNAFTKGARMKRFNPMAKSNMKTLKNSSNDSLLSKAEEQIANDQLELRLESILKTPGSDYDYYLKEGDAIDIPEITLAIRIAGEVQNPIGMAYQSGKNLKYYINRSGGFSDKARKSKTFIIYSDGTTKVTHNFICRRYPDIQPGCQIIVPQKPERQRNDNTGKWLAIASTITTILVAITRL
jgi:protein involved in polysaccharide export with SLBB domain